jgi:extracellular solute-binding protein (family 7)
MLRAADFQGQVVGGSDNELARRTFEALGGSVRQVTADDSLEGLAGLEQQLDSVWGNHYDRQTQSVTSNLNLWPRPLVIIIGKQVLQSLTPDQQAALREAGTAAMPEALEASRAEDEAATANLCRVGFPFVTATPDDLAELRNALEPVYMELARDLQAKSALDTISALKSEVAVSAESPVCPAESGSVVSEAIPNGTYETTVTRDDWLAAGRPEDDFAPGEGDSTFTMEFDDGELTLFGPDGSVGFEASYTIFRDQLTAVSSVDLVRARWSLDGDELSFGDVVSCEGTEMALCSSPDEFDPYRAVWESHPWKRTS